MQTDMNSAINRSLQVRHKVVRVSDVCPNEEPGGPRCTQLCSLCQCCVHLYKCNCRGATKIGKMCKHIHAVIMSYFNGGGGGGTEEGGDPGMNGVVVQDVVDGEDEYGQQQEVGPRS